MHKIHSMQLLERIINNSERNSRGSVHLETIEEYPVTLRNTRKKEQFHWENDRKHMTVHTTQLWLWVINDSKGSKKVECPLENNEKVLQGPCVTVIQKGWNNSPEKKWMKGNGEIMCGSPHNISVRMRKVECPLGDKENNITGTLCIEYTIKVDSSNSKMNGKLSNNEWQSTKYNCENRSTMTQKKVLKLFFNLESTENRYRNIV